MNSPSRAVGNKNWNPFIVNNVKHISFEVDDFGFINVINDDFRLFFKLPKKESTHLNINNFLFDPLWNLTFDCYLKKSKFTGTNVQSYDLIAKKYDGSSLPVTISIQPLQSYRHYSITMQHYELNDRRSKKAKTALFDKEICSGVGHWRYDIETKTFNIPLSIQTLLEQTKTPDLSFYQLTNLIHGNFQYLFERAICHGIEGHPLDEEIKFITPRTQKICWLHFKGDLELQNGSPAYIHGIVEDITERKIKNLKKLNLGNIIDQSMDEIFILNNENLAIIDCNKAAKTNIGYKSKELQTLYFFDLLPYFNRVKLENLLTPLFTHQKSKIILQTHIQHKTGHMCLMELRIKLMLYDEKDVLVIFATDLTEREKLIDELYLAKEEAERANKAKSEFLSQMSHELRTPMNAIIGFAQLMETSPFQDLDEDHKDSLSEINKAGAHLLTLINEILDLARIESGKVNLSIETVNLNELIDEITILTAPVAQNYGTTLVNNIQDNFFVKADRVRLKQVLLNLISNAIKYGSNPDVDDTVSLDSSISSDQQCLITISDQGAGIDPDKLQSVFTPFERCGAEASKIEGTGIGLSITKQMVELMQGQIGVESVLNEGSQFWFTLPQAEPALENLIIEDTVEKVLRFHDTQNTSVLYIEDNPANLKLVERLFENYSNSNFLHAHTASLGIELAVAHQPTLILMDINLPGINGIQAKLLMQEDPRIANIPVIAVSASALNEDINKAKQAGFDDYIIKPFKIEDFIKRTEKFLITHP